jgi:hypothetical protein
MSSQLHVLPQLALLGLAVYVLFELLPDVLVESLLCLLVLSVDWV